MPLSDRIVYEGLTFDDVMLVPARSNVLPVEALLATHFSRNVRLSIPLVSAAMDTVTESRMATALALEGGLGVIHRNLRPADQANQVAAVKTSAVDRTTHPLAAVDAHGRLLVAAAVGVGDLDRAAALVQACVDCLVLDSAHGHSEGVIRTLAELKARFQVDVVAGNVATAAGAHDLVAAGADGIKVGIGPGSICTTRIVSGVGVPQLTAVAECAKAVAGLEAHGVPVCADGGIRYSGDVVKALAAGAHTVMLGSMFARLEESPGQVVEENGRQYKLYRGMGSLGAMQAGSAGRYFQEGKPAAKLVPEGVEGRVPLEGTVAALVAQLTGGLRSGMGYCGCKDLAELRTRPRFVRISPAGLAESHPHDIQLTRTPPNYGPA